MSTQPVSDDYPHQSASRANSPSAILPVPRGLALAYVSSLIIAILTGIASVAGLFYGETLYPTAEMYLLKLPTDIFTLFVGLPILLASMWLTRRGRLLGLLCWPGVLLYLLYIYVSYAVGVPFDTLFLVYVALVTLCAYTTIGLVASVDAAAIRRRLAGSVPYRHPTERSEYPRLKLERRIPNHFQQLSYILMISPVPLPSTLFT